MIVGGIMQTAALAAAVLVCGCAGTPSASDRTPPWMKHHVVGTRIPRVSDANGDASAAGYVLTTTVTQLEDLPSVYIERCRSSFQCR